MGHRSTPTNWNAGACKVSGKPTNFHRGLLAAFQREADPERARQQQAYMKSAMPFLGLAAPTQRRISAQWFTAHPLASSNQWQREILSLWRRARYREERHGALDLIRNRHYADYVTPEIWGLLDELITTGAWWDYIDTLAPNIHAQLLEQHPSKIKPLIMRYARDQDMWRRRTAILCQLKAKSATDEALLFRILNESVDHPEFFVRKAIGWALRAHSRINPERVIEFVETHASRLSPLSKREALKLLLKSGRVKRVPNS